MNTMGYTCAFSEFLSIDHMRALSVASEIGFVLFFFFINAPLLVCTTYDSLL